jgi:hypothetical protein
VSRASVSLPPCNRMTKEDFRTFPKERHHVVLE